MIFLFAVAIIAALAAATPWRTMSPLVRAWALAALINTLLGVVYPSALSSAPLHVSPLAMSNFAYVASIALTVAGLALWWSADSPLRQARRWIAPLVVGALPFLLWTALALLYLIGSRRGG